METTMKALKHFFTNLRSWLIGPFTEKLEQFALGIGWSPLPFVCHIAPQSSSAHPDLLDPRFQKIFWEQYPQQDDMPPELYPTLENNGRNNMTFSNEGELQDWDDFSGTVNYQSISEGYDTTATPVELASGFQVERKLMDDDQQNLMDQKPAGMATAARRTRQ